MVLNFTRSLPGPVTTEQEWGAGHTPGDHEKAWLSPGLGRLGPNGVSVLGGIPGRGIVTAVFTYMGSGRVVGGRVGSRRWFKLSDLVYPNGLSPFGRKMAIVFPSQHEHAVEQLATRLVLLSMRPPRRPPMCCNSSTAWVPLRPSYEPSHWESGSFPIARCVGTNLSQPQTGPASLSHRGVCDPGRPPLSASARHRTPK